MDENKLLAGESITVFNEYPPMRNPMTPDITARQK
jgi:hypothetical protein